MPLSRRQLVLGACTLPLLSPGPGRAERVNEDGLHVQAWFHTSFLILAEDAAEAAQDGRLLAVLWEQRGCSYCRDLHLVNFADPAIRDQAQRHFTWIQMNLYGERPVTDLDGEVLPEKSLARKARTTFTPTIQFIGLDPQPREVARMPGYLPPAPFALMLRYAAEGHWRSGADFLSWSKTQQGA